MKPASPARLSRRDDSKSIKLDRGGMLQDLGKYSQPKTVRRAWRRKPISPARSSPHDDSKSVERDGLGCLLA